MAHSKWIPVPLPAASGAPAGVPAAPLVFGGFTMRNTGVAAVQVDIYDNTSAAGTLLATVDLTAKGSVGACATWEPNDDAGLKVNTGVFVSYSAATVQGSLFVR